MVRRGAVCFLEAGNGRKRGDTAHQYERSTMQVQVNLRQIRRCAHRADDLKPNEAAFPRSMRRTGP